MPRLSSLSPAALAVGDIIIDGKSTILVKKLEWCESHRKGMPRIHVNESLCFDSIAILEVIPNGGN